jgi:hypothetical protein
MSALDTLRAIARARSTAVSVDAVSAPHYEINERNEETPLDTKVISFHSFNSSSDSEQDVAPAPDGDERVERAAIVEHDGGVPRHWAEGYAALCAMPPPIGFSQTHWNRIVDAAGTFLDQWAAEAIRCGWSDLDVFGCHPERPAARFDAMGLIPLLSQAEVVSLDETGADLVTSSGARQRFRRRPLPPGTVSLWDLAIR